MASPRFPSSSLHLQAHVEDDDGSLDTRSRICQNGFAGRSYSALAWLLDGVWFKPRRYLGAHAFHAPPSMDLLRVREGGGGDLVKFTKMVGMALRRDIMPTLATNTTQRTSRKTPLKSSPGIERGIRCLTTGKRRRRSRWLATPPFGGRVEELVGTGRNYLCQPRLHGKTILGLESLAAYGIEGAENLFARSIKAAKRSCTPTLRLDVLSTFGLSVTTSVNEQ